MDRRAQILKHVPLGAGLGLEIGPLHRPIVSRSQADVLYVDHASTADLVAKYAGDPEVDEVVPVDVVWGDGRLREAVGERRAHWVIASHIIEHVPDPVGWLAQIGEVLVPGGVLSLAVPDKRFCFDAKRRVTDVSVFVEAALTGRTRPTLAATYDFWARMTAVDAAAVWAGTSVDDAPDNRELGLEKCRDALSTDKYRDIHASVFTPRSFVDVLGDLAALGLLPPFEMVDVEPTAPGTLEFFATLRWLVGLQGPGGPLSTAQQRERQVQSLDGARAKLAGAAGPAGAGRRVVLSPAEVRLVQLKRDALRTARRAAAAARRRR